MFSIPVYEELAGRVKRPIKPVLAVRNCEDVMLNGRMPEK
jgi:hypothetical protein